MNIKSKMQLFQHRVKLLFLICIALCMLFFFLLTNIYNKANASSVVKPSNHTTFSQSFHITDSMVISADITPSCPAHYYYLELENPASVFLQFSHSHQGHFQFYFHSLDEQAKYTAKTSKASYSRMIENLAAGRYYLTVSCSFYSCTEEHYTLSCSYIPLSQTASFTPAAPSVNNQTENSSISSSSDAGTDINPTEPDNDTGKSSSLSKDEKRRTPKKDKKKTQTSLKNPLRKKKILMRSLQLKNHKKYLYINHSVKLKPKILPKNTTNQSLRFFSSDTSVARVSKKGCVKALKKGTVTITVKSTDGSHLYAAYALKIKKQKLPAADTLTPDFSKPSLLPDADEENKPDSSPVPASSIQLSATALTLPIKKSTHIHASVFPENADDKKLHWKSLNPKTASVRNGKITANARGITTIIVSLKSNPSVRASCTITVT